MTKEKAIEILKQRECCRECVVNNGDCNDCEKAFEMAIKALERDNEEIFKQFKKKVFLESEDVLGNEMVDSYMITDYLAGLLEIEND